MPVVPQLVVAPNLGNHAATLPAFKPQESLVDEALSTPTSSSVASSAATTPRSEVSGAGAVVASYFSDAERRGGKRRRAPAMILT